MIPTSIINLKLLHLFPVHVPKSFWTLSPMALDKRAQIFQAPGSIHPSNLTYILVDFYRNLDVSENSGTPQIIHFNKGFPL